MVDKIQAFEPPAPESQEHVDQMIQKAEEAEVIPSESMESSRPEWLPEKFQSPEDMAKAYGELEKQFSSSRQPQQSQPQEQQQEQPSSAQEYVESKGLNFEAMSQEFSENGQLSDETYTQLEQSGIPRHMTDSWIQGQQAISDKMTSSAFNAAGGEENFNTLIEWAKVNLSEQEINEYNKAISVADPSTIRFTVESLKSRYESKNGQQANLLTGETSNKMQGDRYESVTQLTDAMKDPRYQTDPAFREQVTNKLQRSNIMQ